MNQKQYDELKKRLDRQDQQLLDLHKRLHRQEKLMRMAAVLMLVLFVIWLIVVSWPV